LQQTQCKFLNSKLLKSLANSHLVTESIIQTLLDEIGDLGIKRKNKLNSHFYNKAWVKGKWLAFSKSNKDAKKMQVLLLTEYVGLH